MNLRLVAVTLLLLLAATSIPAYADSVATQVLLVDVDGSVRVKINVSVEDSEALVHTIGIPISVDLGGCPNATYYASNNTIRVYAPSCNSVLVEYLTLDATSKNGSIWILSIDAPYRTIVVLPRVAIPIEITPSPTPVIINGSVALEFPPGRVVIRYLEVPTPTRSNEASELIATSSGSSSSNGINVDTVTFVGLAGALLAGVAIALSRVRSRRGKRVQPVPRVLDDVDRRIVEALRRYGQQTARELMERTGIPKSTLYRRLAKLRDLGIVESVTISGSTVYRLRSSLGEEPRDKSS